MNTAAKTVSWGRLKRRAFSLGAVKAFDKATHFLLPVVLTRCLDAATFGEYRLLWLIVGTVMTAATLNMSGGLFFFVPRSDARGKRLYIHQTMLFLAASGLVCGALVGPWNPLLPAAAAQMAQYGWLIPAFIALWVAAILLDWLPTIDERIRWQAYVTGTTSLLRMTMVAAAAWFTGELRAILWALLAFVLVKLAILLYYVHRHHGLGQHRARVEILGDHVHAGPVLALAGLQGARVRAQAAIGRQQRGVDVEQAATEASHEALAEDAQVAGADDPVRPHGSNGFGKLGVETGAFPVRPGIAAPAQRLGHALQRLGIRAVGEHAGDLRIEVAGRDRVEQRLQVAAAAGGQHRDASQADQGHAFPE